MDGQFDKAEQKLKLMKAIEKFAETRRANLDTPGGAYCMCDSTSDAFIRFAQEECDLTIELNRYDFDLDTITVGGDRIVAVPSPRNPDPTLYQRGKHPVAEFHRAGWHAIVETPEFYLDFTARQYHQDACYPHIISKQLTKQLAAAAAGGK
jgi:hypothetical protein